MCPDVNTSRGTDQSRVGSIGQLGNVRVLSGGAAGGHVRDGHLAVGLPHLIRDGAGHGGHGLGAHLAAGDPGDCSRLGLGKVRAGVSVLKCLNSFNVV